MFFLSISVAKAQTWVQNSNFSTGALTGFFITDIVAVTDSVVWAIATPFDPDSLNYNQSKLFRTINGGNTWQVFNVTTPNNGNVRRIVAFDSLTVVILSKGANNAIYKTTDGARTWTEKLRNFKDVDFMNFFDRSNGILIGVKNNLTIKTGNGGDTWTIDSTTQKPFGGQLVSPISHVVQNKDTIGFTTRVAAIGTQPSPRFYRSTDRGVTWTSFVLPLSNTFSDAVTDFRNGTNGLMTTFNITATNGPLFTNLLKTANGGETWEKLQSVPSAFYNLFVPTVNAIPKTPSSYILHGFGFSNADAFVLWYYSIDDGLTWKTVPRIDVPDVATAFAITDAVFSSPKVGWFAMSTDSLPPRIYKWDGSNVLSSSDDIADGSQLSVSPNPSTGIVTIQWKNAENIPPQYLRVVDALGQTVFEKKGMLETNPQTLDLQQLANGVYILELQFPKQTTTRKLVIQH